jgi:hypothetical protein
MKNFRAALSNPTRFACVASVLLAAASLLASCGGTPTTPVFSATGHWDGSSHGTFFNGALSESFTNTLSVDLIQTGDSLTGTYEELSRMCGTAPCPQGATIGPLALVGTVSGSTILFQAVYCSDKQPISYAGTLTDMTGTGMSGTSIVCTPAHGTGAFTLTRK